MAANTIDNSSDAGETPERIKRVVAELTEQEKVLIVCNDQLYGGRWDLLRNDLQNRLDGQPYVLKLGTRIKDDLERVQKLEAIEKEFQIKLSDFVEL